MRLARTSGSSAPEGWPELYGWIQAWLQDKTTPRKVVEWHGWAHNRLREGWTHEQVKDRMRESWGFARKDLLPLEQDLMDSLSELYRMADSGWTPAQCAVVYRSLHRVHPKRQWLLDWAERWEEAGDDWQAVKFPDRKQLA